MIYNRSQSCPLIHEEIPLSFSVPVWKRPPLPAAHLGFPSHFRGPVPYFGPCSFLRPSLLSPFECLRGNFILPKSANHIFFLRNLLYFILPSINIPVPCYGIIRFRDLRCFLSVFCSCPLGQAVFHRNQSFLPLRSGNDISRLPCAHPAESR